MTDRPTYRFDSGGTYDGEIADSIGSDLVEGSGRLYAVQIRIHTTEKRFSSRAEQTSNLETSLGDSDCVRQRHAVRLCSYNKT